VTSATGAFPASDWTDVDWRPYLHDALSQGGAIRYLDIGQGPSVLLVHGLGATWRTWVRNIEPLAANHRVIAVDLPGFGRSERLDGRVGMNRLGDALADLLDWLDISAATVIGHSMGGLVVERLALDHARRVSALGLVCTGGIPFSAVTRALFVSSMLGVNLLLRDRFRRSVVLGIPPVRDLMIRGLVADPRSLTPALANELFRGVGSPGYGSSLVAGTGEDFRAELSSISCPTVVLAGGRDRLAPKSFAVELSDRIPGGRLEIWDDVGHCPMLEQPERFNELVSGLARQAAPC
jgi:pimeloyl-ACP methyl ester carboxylesterase